MLASIVLATFICSPATHGEDKCDVEFTRTYVNTTLPEFKRDGIDCLDKLEALPDVEADAKEPLKFKYYGCYTVQPYHKAGYVQLVSMLDQDDSFTQKIEAIEVK